MKRYQIYLSPQSVGVIDEISDEFNLSRSMLIQKLVDAAANRAGNLLAMVFPPKVSTYSKLDKIVGMASPAGRKTAKLSENVDEIYYK